MTEQIFIAITGVTAVLLTQQSNDDWKRYACILGILGQPFWFYASWKAEQWGIFVLCFFYLYAWVLGFYNNWVKK